MSDRHEWLNLLEVSGPFLAVPVLREVFPQGLEELDASRARRLRSAYEEWRDAVDGDDADRDKLHAAWFDEVLRTALEADDQLLKPGKDVPASVVALPEHDTTIASDFVFVDPTRGGAVLAPVHVFPPDTDLSTSMQFGGLSCSPGDRMALYLRTLNVPCGMVTNGERWMLVHAPTGQVATFASWYARVWGQEPATLRAFTSLLGVRRFFAPAQDRLPALFERSLKHQDEVTDALGDQVRRAIEVLVQALDRADQDRNRELLRDVKSQELYEAGLAVMMRLVFLLAAEERGLLLLGEPRYDSFYAVSTLRMQLRAESDEILERRRASWSRLLAVFRAVFGGIDHPTLRLPALGGSLFDPDRFPFLEGRLKGTSWRQHRAEPLPIDDRTVLHILDALQTVTIRRAEGDGQSGSNYAERRTISYRALDVEQIGHVYEGLLERTVARVEDVTLELEGGTSPELARVTLGEIEAAHAAGPLELGTLLSERSSRTPSAIRRALARELDEGRANQVLAICRGDVRLRDRILPYAALVRRDVWGALLVHLSGAFVIVLGANRRETGTHYTPKHVAESVVQTTLEPLAYDRPSADAPRSTWTVRPSANLLALRVCDPAMGSGAFLVQACRYLGARVAEAWLREDNEPRSGCGNRDSTPAPTAADAEALVLRARQLVAERCLYGVDLNPLAVELTKLSLWLVTLAKSRPFGFLDHHLRCGDALLGAGQMEELTDLLPNQRSRQVSLFGNALRRMVDIAMSTRRELELLPIRDIADVDLMTAMNDRAAKALTDAGVIADALVGIRLATEGTRAIHAKVSELIVEAECLASGDRGARERLRARSASQLAFEMEVDCHRATFHWPLAFPEALVAGGFDAVLGNPPWVSYAGRAAQPLSDSLRRYYLSSYKSFAGYRNLQGLFVERIGALVRPGGRLGVVIPSSMAELDGYGPVRKVHDRVAICDDGLPNLPENTFRRVNQPSMVLYSTMRAARLEVGSDSPWPMDRPDLDDLATGVLKKLDGQSLPPSLFGERGLQTSGDDVEHLTASPDGAHRVALRVGGDIQPFQLGSPSQYADDAWFGNRLRLAEEWRAIEILIRQTARVPIAARSDGAAFRNSLLAGFGSTDYPAHFLVAYLNSLPVRWRHYFRNRDARLGMPQMKIGHLRAIPAPPTDVVAKLEAIGRDLSVRNQGITPDEQETIDDIVATGFALDAKELARMRTDAARWVPKANRSNEEQASASIARPRASKGRLKTPPTGQSALALVDVPEAEPKPSKTKARAPAKKATRRSGR